MSTFSPRRLSAFTLTELLVTVAIISALAAFLIPALSTALERSRSTKCLGHLRQLALGMSQYADEHNNQFPLGGNDASAVGASAWYFAIAPYVGIADGEMGLAPKPRAVGPFLCPSFKPLENRAASYGINIYMMNLYSPWRYKRLVCPNPAGTILIGEKNYNTDQVYPSGASARSAVEKRHLDGANYVMVDLHAEFIAGDLPATDSRWKWW